MLFEQQSVMSDRSLSSETWVEQGETIVKDRSHAPHPTHMYLLIRGYHIDLF